ncbi:ATP-dependent RNA helicase DeaD [Caloramator quimbayensis]|uniref:ATP-dependent RNA helicase CshA n=1 Tax=Caloramator quimbayensis TaxID=1147123 RepID=A0A1T4XES9_9CLOT|nr:DEAD/DEAH box helicase [Caloramator quimbayensis]SKA88082.1 ATP-dependent RNA helicase DeaD [Caloramator quimbayensis]
MDKLKFEDLGLSKELLRAVEDMGFEEPSPIQRQAIPVVLEGKDVIGQAQTGTGKTAAFGMPVLELINSEKVLQAVILCPTRELAIQVAEEMKKLGKYKKGIEILPVYGGQSIDRQIKSLKKGVHIIVGTPGRVMDHINRNTIDLSKIKVFVLDEADEMLDMGFREDIEFILKKAPVERQTLLFSATMPKPILELTEKYQKNPQTVKVVHKELTAPKIEQYYFEVKEKNKLDVLSRVIDVYNPYQSLVFCNTKKKVDELVDELQSRGYAADGLHGDMKQSQRDKVMAKFRKGITEILVATDVAARGIDVENIDTVFNYDMPQDEEYYVHRIGRTARAGKSGRAFTFVAGRDFYKLKDIQRYTKTKIIRKDIPTIGDVEEIKNNALIERIKAVVEEGGLEKYSSIVEKLLDEEYSSLDVCAALIKMLSKKDDRVENADDEFDFENTGGAPGMARLFINIGRRNHITPKNIVGAIAGETGLPGKLIGTIDIYDKYTFVEVPKEYASEVIKVMKDNEIKGNKVNIEPANAR